MTRLLTAAGDSCCDVTAVGLAKACVANCSRVEGTRVTSLETRDACWCFFSLPDSHNAHSHSEHYFMFLWHNRLYLYSAAALLFGVWFSVKVALTKVSCHRPLQVVAGILYCSYFDSVVSSCWVPLVSRQCSSFPNYGTVAVKCLISMMTFHVQKLKCQFHCVAGILPWWHQPVVTV